MKTQHTAFGRMMLMLGLSTLGGLSLKAQTPGSYSASMFDNWANPSPNVYTADVLYGGGIQGTISITLESLTGFEFAGVYSLSAGPQDFLNFYQRETQSPNAASSYEASWLVEVTPNPGSVLLGISVYSSSTATTALANPTFSNITTDGTGAVVVIDDIYGTDFFLDSQNGTNGASVPDLGSVIANTGSHATAGWPNSTALHNTWALNAAMNPANQTTGGSFSFTYSVPSTLDAINTDTLTFDVSLVPEPSSMSLFLLSVIGLLCRRHR
ncbi:MAG: PEP-CTERM sorting domain-containing protein [Verrucomicrobiales bacterium]|nr:PEP-CTERM sorting domain-containing protein [Verrucomicrobiales bacterium]